MPKKQAKEKSRFFILTGKMEPVILVDEEGNPGSFDTAQEARDSANRSMMSQAFGYRIVEMNNGVLEVE